MPNPLTLAVYSATRTAADFEVLAAQAARLKPRGRVEMMVNSLAERTAADVPPGGSPWHDYTSMLPAIEKLYPHRDLAPFVDAEHVRKNQQLLGEKLPILRRHKLAAAVQFHLPWMLPEPFFASHPHLRGPRIDHPRRSRREAFAICVDTEQGRSFYGEMFGQLAREVPELSAVHISTNDAGGGFCWADWLYNGPNGPGHCKDRGVGTRVRGLVDALRAAAPGRAIDIDLRGNFSDPELRDVARFHDEHFDVRGQHGPAPRQVQVGSVIDNPVLGVFDPVGILRTLDRLRTPQVDRVVVGFSTNYSRGHERHDVQEKVIDLLDAYLAEPVFGLMNRLAFLRAMCARWVGEEQADALLEALHEMHDAYVYRAATVPLFSSNYASVSIRHINRPLVAVPQRLTPEEEDYWLPHVFNPHQDEARRDYIDFHGGRMFAAETLEGTDPRVGPIVSYGARMNGVADRLAALTGPAADVFRRMGTSLRIHASALRSSGNFYAVQRIRDRNQEKFAGEPRLPSKVGDWYGDRDLQKLNELLRDELDNTSELIRILESGGMSQVLTAQDPAEEDTFLLGPDLINQLKKKTQIMRRHWLDAEQYLATPLK